MDAPARFGPDVLDLLLERINGPSCVLSEDGAVQRSNPQWRSLGVAQPGLLAEVGPAIARASCDGAAQLSPRALRVDGAVATWNGRVTRVSIDGGAAFLVELTRAAGDGDIRWQQLIDSMPQIIWSARPDGYLDYYNRKWFELTGADPDGQGDPSWLPILHPDDRQKCLDLWYHSVRTGEPYEIEYRFKFAGTGEYRWQLGRALPVREGGEIVRWFGTCTDIHEQKLAEEALREADHRKDEFLGMLSHELRNPIAPIRSAVHVLEHGDARSEDASRARHVVVRQTEHLTRLIDELLDVTRIMRGKIELRREPVELRELVRTVAADFRSVLEERGIAFDVRLPTGEAWVHADATRLLQVFGNLLHNASKFTEDNGRVTMKLTYDGPELEVSVADDGVGIDAELLPRVFDAFVQGENDLARTEGGLGLGLALVKGIVEMHGGAVGVRSAGPNRGAEFVVRLPAVAAPRRRRAPSAERGCTSRRVLVCDDNRDGADSLAAVLRLRGHRVDVTYDGETALRHASTSPPEVVLCDIGLPGMNGYEIASELRAKLGAAVRLVALSGYARPEDIAHARAAGFDGHLRKPATVAELERLMS